MANKVGERLKHEALKLRFTTANGPNGAPKTVLKRTSNQTVNEIVQPASYNQGQPSLLYYELLDVSITELETKRSLKVFWTGAHNKEEVSSEGNPSIFSFGSKSLTNLTLSNLFSLLLLCCLSVCSSFPTSKDEHYQRCHRTTPESRQAHPRRISTNQIIRNHSWRKTRDHLQPCGNDWKHC